MWALLAVSCSLFDPVPAFLDAPAAHPPARPSPHPARAIALSTPGIDARFSLPRSSRPGGAPAPDAFPVGPLTLHDQKNRADVYRARLPVEASLLPSAGGGTHRFGSKPPVGFAVTGPEGAELRFERNAREPGTWGFDPEWLYIGVRTGAPPPDGRKYAVHFPKATATENGLNLDTSGLSPDAFAKRTVTVGGASHAGLLVPAPGEVAFSLVAPVGGALDLDAQLLRPAIVDRVRSDGAAVVVIVRADGAETEVARVQVDEGADAVPVRADLSRWGGAPIELVLRTEPGADPTYDYVLLEAPTVYAPDPDPERIVIVFVDTLRTDHLGFMGYARRPTSPLLDGLAAHATVFTQARTVAPWTLPSARAMLTGHEPEAWSEPGVRTLPEVLGAEGWRTDAIVSNAFLSQPFEVHRGWDAYDFAQLRDPRDVVARGIDALERHADRDQLLLVHFMSPHLPYDEPWTYRHVFAGARPPGIRSISRAGLLSWLPGRPGFDAVRAYVDARYDQQIRFVDDTLRSLVRAAGPRATIAVVSDHGEELWDHGGFEHGHAFWDELLHVPFAIRSPYLPAVRVDAPVSVLDLTPTLRALAGAPPDDDAPGRSLVPVAWGDAGAAEALSARGLAFGRPLYGPDGWGVVADDHKWWDRGGVQALFDLGRDPGERLDLAPRAPDLDAWPAHLSAALGRPVRLAWRVEVRAEHLPFALELGISHPDGLADAWLEPDPRGQRVAAPELLPDGVRAHLPAGLTSRPVLYVVPTGDALAPEGLAVSLVGQTLNLARRVGPGRLAPSYDPETVLAIGDARVGVTVELAWVPEPSGDATPGYHPEMEDQLRELGYLDTEP